MKVVALVLGIVGGVAGLISGCLAVIFVATSEGVVGAEFITGIGFAVIVLGVLGIVGGALAVAEPKLAGILMTTSAVMVIAARCITPPLLGGLVAGLLLLIGGILGFVGQR